MPENLPTILIIVVIAVICVIAVLSMIKRGKQGCCGAGGGDIREKIVKDTANFTHRYRVKIGGDGHLPATADGQQSDHHANRISVQPAGRRVCGSQLEGRHCFHMFAGTAYRTGDTQHHHGAGLHGRGNNGRVTKTQDGYRFVLR